VKVTLNAIAALALLLVASLPATARLVHIVAFGDSLTYGWLLRRAQSYPAQLQAALRQKGYDVVVKNAGIGGDTVRHALQRFDRVIDPDTDICIVEFGLNDRSGGVSLKTISARVTALVRALKARRIEVLVLGLGGLHFADLAVAEGVLSVDFTLPPHKYRARDGGHYNAQGYAMLVERLLPSVETMIKRVHGKP